VVLRRALKHLSAAAARVEPIAALQRQAEDALPERHGDIAERSEYGLLAPGGRTAAIARRRLSGSR
jgi:hypothetical protein